MVKKYGLATMVNSWGHQPPTVLQLGNYPDFLTSVEVPGTTGKRNMAVVDIFRDRCDT